MMSSIDDTLLDSYFLLFYAQEVLAELPIVVKQKCEGCNVESLSQTHHVCLSFDACKRLSLYFNDVLEAINETAIIQKWKQEASSINDISYSDLTLHEQKLNCADWRTTLKTFSWRQRLLKTALQVYRLERCFEIKRGHKSDHSSESGNRVYLHM